MKLSIAIVSYHSHLPVLKRVLKSLAKSVEKAKLQWPELLADLYFIENDPRRSGSTGVHAELERLEQGTLNRVQIIENHKNRGYGGGHNCCLKQLDSEYHLILNPDVILAEDFLQQGLSCLEKDRQHAIIAPYVSNEKKQPAYLCKRYPSVLDLWLRGFMPGPIQNCFRERLDRYQMKDVYEAGQLRSGIPIISGCCMLIRTDVFRKLKGFDERFFLYFEDFDLSLRAAHHGAVTYNPAMKIEHMGGFSARKGLWHIQQFARSGWQFFSKHGWKWY